MKSESFEKWASEHTYDALDVGREALWPSETLVRIFKGRYVPGLEEPYDGKTVLDVGCGNGNNLVFLASLGLACSGTEVTGSICRMTQERLAQRGLQVDVRAGTNRELPFEDNTFDYLVSWNVVHYEDNEADIRAAIAEYHRVLKKGGRFVLSTTGPEHKILHNSRKRGAHLYEIGREDDFRKGEVFFYFDAPDHIHHYFGEKFSDVLVGRTHDVIFTDTLDWFIATGVKE